MPSQLCYIIFSLHSVAIGKTERLFTLHQRIVQAFQSGEFSHARILKHILGKLLPLHVFAFPGITALLFSLQSATVGEMVQARFSTQIDAAAAARLMKVCSELCGDARCRDVS